MAVVDNWVTGNAFSATDENNIAKAVNGSGWLQPCNYATVGTETFTVAGGSVTGITGVNIDGAAPPVGARVLIKDAPAATGVGSPFSTQPGNGVYVIVSNITNITVARVAEMSGTYSPAGVGVVVMAGTVNAAEQFVVVTPNTSAAFTWGSGNVAWKNYPAPGSIVDLASAQSVSGKILADTFMGQSFEALKVVQNTVLPASSVLEAFVSLELPATYSLEVPATSSLEVLDVVGVPKGFLAAPGANHATMISNGLAYVGREATLADIQIELRHDFTTKADGVPASSSDSNHQWTQFYNRIAALPTISGGRFVDADTASGQSANYLLAQLNGTCTYIEAEFDFGSTGSTTGSCANVAAISGIPPSLDGLITTPLPDAACHTNFFVDRYEFSVITGGALAFQQTIFYQTAFATTTMQHIEIVIDKTNSVLYVRGADGNVVGHHHATIGTASCPYVWFENISPNPNTDKRSQFAKVGADSVTIRNTGQEGASKAMTLLMVGQNADQANMRDSSLILFNTTVANKYVGFSAANTISGQKPIMSFPMVTTELYGAERYVALASEVNLNTSVAETSILATTNALGQLGVGTTYKFRISGTVQVQATSGVLTFRVYIGANASAETYVMATQVSAAGPVAFYLEALATVRSTGASGTYVSSGYGEVNFTSVAKLVQTVATTAVVDTTAFLPTAKLTAQWATSSATNILKVENAIIERLL